MTEPNQPTTIIAIVTEDGAEAIRRHAIALAQASGAGLILWDADAGKHLLDDPLPTAWSADGQKEQFSDRLTVNDLEAAGRAPLARQVREAHRAGVEAWGWLPSNTDADTLRDYVLAQGASVVVVGADSDLGDGLEGTDVRVEVAGPA